MGFGRAFYGCLHRAVGLLPRSDEWQRKMLLEMLCIQYQHQETGLVFPAPPKEFLHGLEKTSIDLAVKRGLGIVPQLIKLPPMKSGGLFSWFRGFRVVMSEVQRPERTQPVPLHCFYYFFIIREDELCCLVASGSPGLVGGFLALCSPHTASALQPLSAYEHPGKAGNVIAPILQTGSTEDFFQGQSG